MKWISNHKKLFIVIVIIVFIIAGIIDLKFEGLLYRMLPASIQSSITDMFNL